MNGRAIDAMFARQREINEKLSPSKDEMRFVTDYAKVIYEHTQLMNNASEMAHQGLIDFELAQKIMNTQKKNIKRDIKYLQSFLGLNEEETE
ncbi:hypothetical protein ACQVTS_28515 [Bacillus mycoides]|uniref:hypothetical protein n=1 Tax=Bacillus mycoides TaxID=1405 RepID=UPI003D652625